jgi:hypothetical protein
MPKKLERLSEEHRRRVGEGVRRAWKRRKAMRPPTREEKLVLNSHQYCQERLCLPCLKAEAEAPVLALLARPLQVRDEDGFWLGGEWIGDSPSSSRRLRLRRKDVQSEVGASEKSAARRTA